MKATSSFVAWGFLVLDLLYKSMSVQVDASVASNPLSANIQSHLTLTDNLGETIQIPFTNVPPARGDLPPKKRMKVKKLLKRLGKDYDPFWMSAEELSDPVHQLIPSDKQPDSNLLLELSTLNMTLYRSNGSLLQLQPVIQEALNNWLIKRSSCPVHYVWVDQGLRWWPRWVKTGVCIESGPCSWPPGMHCVPGQSKILRLLRWHCRSRSASRKAWKKVIGKFFKAKMNRDEEIDSTDFLQLHSKPRKTGGTSNSQTAELVGLQKLRKLQSKGRKKKCKWIKVPYPVTPECFCSC